MKKIAALLTVCILIIGLSACGSNGNTNSLSKETESKGEMPLVRVAVLDQQTGLAAWYAHEMGWDKEKGFEMELQTYSSGAPANEALGAGIWDVGFVGAAAVNSIKAYGAYQIGEYFTSAGDINLIVREGSEIMENKGVNEEYPEIYGDADSVKGSKIILPVGSGHHICVSQWLKALGLEDTDVQIVNMEFAQGYQAFISGEGDIFACSYPYTDLLLEDGYQKACTMTDIKTPYYDNIVVSKDFYSEENREILVSIIEIILKAGNHFAEDEDDYVAQCTEYLSLNGKDTSDAEAMRASTLKSVFLTSEEAKTHEVGSSLRVIAEFQVEQGSITKDDYKVVEEHIVQDIMDSALEKF
ncbi:ABC transporter substrate-binding protein [Mediterraneibacter sp. NSJ-55]|uniref:ABC transporter substrate-binding protein n=1 Tax=Mediterraneibacter hominis TaxID=2763054 RepID=A0A923RRD1_9FIRM|nr:ABC transporter substrate-binding protein [Mediterraneibacter hominis]MBC5690451.1 ABC transporter substrate-binding protein [Mediterraneibacter hominis]